MNVITVKNILELNSLKDLNTDTAVYVENTEEYFIRKNNNWSAVQIKTDANSNIKLSLYDLNKQLIGQMPKLNNEELKEKAITISNLHTKYNNNYYMLYGKEISYFTLFKINDPTYFYNEIVDCLKNIGDIKSIENTKALDAVECWVQNEDEVTCLYLFPYDSGLVEVGE